MSDTFRYTLLPPAACLLLANAPAGQADPHAAIALDPPQVQAVYAPAPPPPLPPPPVSWTYPAPPPPPNYKGKPARPANDPGSWVSDDDYPARALSEGREGTTGVRLTIDTRGRVTDCQITASSGSPDLDATTCEKLMRRASFVPARDARGKKTVGSFSQRIRWTLPQERLPPEAGLGVSSYIVELDRTVSACRVERMEGAAQRQATVGPIPCNPQMRVLPPVDAQGKPVRTKVVSTIEVKVEPVEP